MASDIIYYYAKETRLEQITFTVDGDIEDSTTYKTSVQSLLVTLFRPNLTTDSRVIVSKVSTVAAKTQYKITFEIWPSVGPWDVQGNLENSVVWISPSFGSAFYNDDSALHRSFPGAKVNKAAGYLSVTCDVSWTGDVATMGVCDSGPKPSEEDPSVLLPILLGVLIPLVTGIVVFFGYRRWKRNKKPTGTAPPPVMTSLRVHSMPREPTDWVNLLTRSDGGAIQTSDKAVVTFHL